MVEFIILAVLIGVITSHSPEEWKEIIDNIEEQSLVLNNDCLIMFPSITFRGGAFFYAKKCQDYLVV